MSAVKDHRPPVC